MPNDIAVKKMMDACDKDPKLQAELFKDPKGFAKKYDVTLGDDEVKQLNRVGALMQLVAELGRVVPSARARSSDRHLVEAGAFQSRHQLSLSLQPAFQYSEISDWLLLQRRGK